MKFPALGMIETNSIARGILVHDLMSKKADIKILQSNTICPGKYIVIIAGDVDNVWEAMREGRHYGGQAVIDSLFIPNISDEIFTAMVGAAHNIEVDSVAIIETFSATATINLADMAVKRSGIRLLDIRIAQGLGGKAYFIITGPLHEVEDAANFVGTEAEPGMLTNIEIIPAPSKSLSTFIGGRII